MFVATHLQTYVGLPPSQCLYAPGREKKGWGWRKGGRSDCTAWSRARRFSTWQQAGARPLGTLTSGSMSPRGEPGVHALQRSGPWQTAPTGHGAKGWGVGACVMMSSGPFPALPGDSRKQVISLECSLMRARQPDCWVWEPPGQGWGRHLKSLGTFCWLRGHELEPYFSRGEGVPNIWEDGWGEGWVTISLESW